MSYFVTGGLRNEGWRIRCDIATGSKITPVKSTETAGIRLVRMCPSSPAMPCRPSCPVQRRCHHPKSARHVGMGCDPSCFSWMSITHLKPPGKQSRLGSQVPRPRQSDLQDRPMSPFHESSSATFWFFQQRSVNRADLKHSGTLRTCPAAGGIRVMPDL